MSELTITTDHKWKNFLYGYELTAKEKKNLIGLTKKFLTLLIFSAIAAYYTLFLSFL